MGSFLPLNLPFVTVGCTKKEENQINGLTKPINLVSGGSFRMRQCPGFFTKWLITRRLIKTNRGPLCWFCVVVAVRVAANPEATVVRKMEEWKMVFVCYFWECENNSLTELPFCLDVMFALATERLFWNFWFWCVWSLYFNCVLSSNEFICYFQNLNI